MIIESQQTQPKSSPFHRGEREIQERLGVRERLEEQGRRVIRDSLPDQHREFYAHLPFVLLGGIDQAGRPWASVLVGQPSFISSPDPSTLKLNARPIYDDPLNDNLVPDSDVGMLGIEFYSRRRNRMAGKIVSVGNGAIEIRVVQSFGNCPQYIQARDCELSPAIGRVGEERPVERLTELGEAERTIISQADNFYIASQFSEDQTQASHGIDVSHRGGKPGFVRVDDNHTLTWPDFVGNFHFNTLGNILLNPQVGLLFIDFSSQDLVYLTGSAEIIWDGEELRAFTGAQRLVRFSLHQAIRVAGALPMQWRFQNYSPSLEQTGSWQEVATTLAARAEGNSYREYEVTRVEQESANISSFYLEPKGEEPISCHTAGQFLPLELHPVGMAEPLLRTYTISNAPNGSFYRLSIKREPAAMPGLPPGIASNYFHEHVTRGTILRAMSPRGKFTLETTSTHPIVLLSAGVGITPMLSMLNQLINEGTTCGCQRPI
jgi:predicted pyridoxine 5'-phosphate oxidase superfamily flavin-nucleotide-binding protein